MALCLTLRQTLPSTWALIHTALVDTRPFISLTSAAITITTDLNIPIAPHARARPWQPAVQAGSSDTSGGIEPAALVADLAALGVQGPHLGEKAPELLVDMNLLYDAVVGILEDDQSSISEAPTPAVASGSNGLEQERGAAGSVCKLESRPTVCPSPRLSTLFPCASCGAAVGQPCVVSE